MFLEAASLLNYRLDWTVILNDITQEKKSWDTRETKLSSSIVWRVAWKKPCPHFRVWLRRINRTVDLIKKHPWQKTKTPPAGQKRNRGWIIPPRLRKDLKSRTHMKALTQAQRHVEKSPYKRELYAQGRNSTVLDYHPPTKKRNFQRTLMMVWNVYSIITGYP